MKVCVWDAAVRRSVCGAYDELDAWTRSRYEEIGKLRRDRDDPAVNCLGCMSDERRAAVFQGVDRRVIRHFERQIDELRRGIAAHQREIEDAGPVKVRRGYRAVVERKHRADRRLWSMVAAGQEEAPSDDR